MEGTIIFVISTSAFLVVSTAAPQLLDFQCTTGGERCMIPFAYQGREYFHCATVDTMMWCPTGVDPTGSYRVAACTVCEAPPLCYLRADEIPKSVWKVTCPPGCSNVTSRLWTSRRNPTQDFYSMDSFVCAAAIQDGKINDAMGGVVTVKRAGSQRYKVTNTDIKHSTTRDIDPKLAPLFSVEKSSEDVAPMIFVNLNDIGIVHKGSVKTVVEKLQNAVSIALDARKQILYWGDVRESKIYRVNVSSPSAPVETLSSLQVKTPDGIAVDWVHNLFYWTDAGLHSVKVCTDVGEHSKTLIIRTELFLPRAIALDPLRGFMYVSDWGQKAKIEQCSMDGEKCQTVVGHDVAWPNGLTLDIENELIYWADAQLHTISVATTKGMFRRELVASPNLVNHPYSIVLHSDRLYWTDWHKGIVSVNKETGEDVLLHHKSSYKLMGLAINDQGLQPEYHNRCQLSSCKFLCIPIPSGRRCVCPDGFYPQGENDCKRSRNLLRQDSVLSDFFSSSYQTYDAKDVFDEEKQEL